VSRRGILAGAGGLCAALLAVAAQAQTCHALSGAWTLDETASLMGPGLSFNPYYRVDAGHLTLSVKDGTVRQAWRLQGPHLDEQLAYDVPVDGRPHDTGATSKVDSTPLSVTAVWQNCTLIVEGRSSLFGLTIPTVTTYVFSPDGKTLTLLQTSHAPIGDTERRLVFRADAPEVP
jgi:hypothetical protein